MAAVFVGVVQAAAPTNSGLPTIVGSFQQNQTLTASTLPGAWANSPTLFTYQWLSCGVNGNNCVPIVGATSATYVVAAGDVGTTIRVQVTGNNADGSNAATSNQTPVIVSTGAPVSTAAPTIQGANPPQQGQQLTGQAGTWTGELDVTLYQWLNCDSSGNNCVSIAGATNQNYTPQASDVGDTLRLLVNVLNELPGDDGAGRAVSSQTAAVIGPGPVNTAKPTITGAATEGQTLTAGNGTWTSPNGSPITYTYQWQRCNTQGQSCVNIAGATQATYVVQQADVGSTLVVVVTATNSQGPQSAASNATPVVGGVPAGQTIPVSQVSLSAGNRLVVSSVNYEPNVLRSRAPFELTVQITDVLGHLVSGAAVDFTPVPFERVLPPQTVTTNQQGFATVTLQPTAQFPLIKGYRIVVFVRATKPGDNIVAGVTGLRLTSVVINPS